VIRLKTVRMKIVGANPQFLATFGRPRIPTPIIVLTIVTVVKKIDALFPPLKLILYSEEDMKLVSLRSSSLKSLIGKSTLSSLTSSPSPMRLFTYNEYE
jgi:hypothetical protein